MQVENPRQSETIWRREQRQAQLQAGAIHSWFIIGYHNSMLVPEKLSSLGFCWPCCHESSHEISHEHKIYKKLERAMLSSTAGSELVEEDVIVTTNI